MEMDSFAPPPPPRQKSATQSIFAAKCILVHLPIRKPIGKILVQAFVATLLAFNALGRLRQRKQGLGHSSASETTSRLPTASA